MQIKSREYVLISVTCVVLALSSGCIMFNRVGIGVGDKSDTLIERTVIPADGRWARNKVLMLDIAGVMTTSSGNSLLGGYEPSPVESIRAAIECAREDDHVKGLLLRINSPGGEMTATDMIYEELRRYKDDEEVAVVAALMQVAASGGYYVACVSDRIIAHPTTVTGSISVISNLINIERLMDKVGVEHVAIKSGEKKDMGSFFRELTDEEREIFMDMVQDAQARFLEVVDEGRSALTRDEVVPLADGRIFTATQAQKAGLIDEIGYLEDAFEAVKEEAGLKDAALVVYTYRTDGAPNIYSPTGTAPSTMLRGSMEEQLMRYLRSLTTRGQPSLLCLWEAGLFRLLAE